MSTYPMPGMGNYEAPNFDIINLFMPELGPTESFDKPLNVTQRKEGEFPRDIEGRMDATLLACRIAPQAAILLLVGNSPIDVDSLTDTFRKKLSGSQMTPFRKETITNYYHALAKAGFIRESSNQLLLTDEGRKYGLPTAALFLDFERQHGFSLYPIFSTGRLRNNTYSTPGVRAKILEGLEEAQVKTEKQISMELGLDHTTVARSLAALDKVGVVKYRSAKHGTGKDLVTYALSGEKADIDAIKQLRRATQRGGLFVDEVVAACFRLGYSDQPINIPNILKYLPKQIREQKRREISPVLSLLADEGFLQRVIYKGGEVMSDTRLEEKGKIIRDHLLKPLRDVLSDGPTLQSLERDLLPKVVGSLSNYATEATDLYYPYSISFKQREIIARDTKIFDTLTMAGKDGFAAEEIAQITGEHRSNIRRRLKKWINEGLAKGEDRNNVFYYSLAEATLAA